MTFVNKSIKKIATIFLILLMLIPFNTLFINKQINTNHSNDLTDKEKEEENLENPSLSALDLGYELKINDSKVYPNRTFYLIRGDYLYFELYNKSVVSNVRLIVQDLSINQLFTQSGNKFSLTQHFDYSKGRYLSKVSFINDSKTVEIIFYLNISILGPQILKAWARDTTYNTQWTEIYEGGIYSTYRNTDVEFIVETYNREGPTSSLKLTYNDGISTLSLNGQILNTNGNKRNFTFSQGASNPVQVYIDTSSGNENRWKLSKNLYTFKFNASYGSKYYIFEFYLEILNKPPKITLFEITPTIVENPSGDKTSVIVKANASDFEDDILWYRGTTRAARYTDKVTDIGNNSGCVINSPSSDLNYAYLQNDDDNFYNLTYKDGDEGEFLLFVKINDDINITYIQWFETKLVIYDKVSGVSLKASLDIWNYNTNTWNQIADLAKIVDDWTTVINRSSDLSFIPINYIPQSNATLKFRIYYNYTSDIEIRVDMFTLTTQVQRRETFSRIILSIYSPRFNSYEFRQIELVNYWDPTQKQYWYKFDIENSVKYYGSWTIQITFIDHGSFSYHNLIWGNFSESTSSSPKESHNYDYNDQNQEFALSTGRAVATRIFSLGISKSEALNITGMPYTNSSNGMTPEHNETFSLNIDVNGIDTASFDEYHKIYYFRREPTYINVQKNDTASINSKNGEPGEYISGTSISNITDDDDNAYGIVLRRNTTQSSAEIAALWSIIVLDRYKLESKNISKIFIDLDSWFNDTSLIQDTYFEFYNFSANQWTTPSTGNWHNDGNLTTTVHDRHFVREISNRNDIDNFIGGNIMKLRLRIVPTNPAIEKDIQLDIDFINITIEVNYSYTAQLNLLGYSYLENSQIKQEIKSINLNPTPTGSWSIKYSCTINIYQFGFDPNVFGFSIFIANGNSTILYTAYRKAPRVKMDINMVKEFMSNYYYNKTDEINYLNKNYTLNIQNPNYNFIKEIFLRNRNKISSTNSKNILFVRNRDRLITNATFDFKSLSINNVNLDFEVQIKEGLTENRILWQTQVPIHIINTSAYSFSKDIVDSDRYNIYFIRYYFRSHRGEEFATEWREFRIINFQPVDFSFSQFSSQSLYRGAHYNFQFSFLDYDMSSSWASNNLNKIKVRFLINNKTNGNSPEWIYANLVYDGYSNYIHFLTCDLLIPYSVQTGQDQMIYYNWQFWIEDENSLESIKQYQRSFINYTKTKLTVINRIPSITSITLNGQGAGIQITRHTNMSIKIYLSDDDEPSSGLYLEIIDLNITTPPTMPNVNVHNDSVKIVNTYREYIYYINRSAKIAQYNITVKIKDSDGKEVMGTTYFYVINSPPQVNSITFSQNQIYRNIDGDPIKYDPVIFYVNVSDAEDSYFDDNASASVTLTINNINPYRSKIQQVSNVLPITLNLTLKYCGNDTNGHTELWIGQYQFNETVNGQKLFAGVLSLLANVTDGEGASGTLTNTDFELYNYQPQKHSELDTEIGMEEASTYYVKGSIDEGEDIDIYIFVSDKEGLASLKLWYIPLVGTPGQEVRDKAQTISLTSNEWNATLYKKLVINNETTEIYRIKITIKYDDLPEDTVKIEIDDLVVYDNDYGYKDDTDQGATSIKFKEIRGVQIEINITSKPPTTPVVIYILMGVGIALLGIVVVVGVVYYRKRTGYRKFLD
ncbi:MAG: hypothetical protein ACTSQP_12870 [Promethearchaeota archaeon]